MRSLDLTLIFEGNDTKTYNYDSRIFQGNMLFLIWNDFKIEGWNANITFWQPIEYNNIDELVSTLQSVSANTLATLCV